MNLFRSLAVFILLGGYAITLEAQRVYNLDLETSILIAKEQSVRVLVLKKRLERASYDLKAATSSLRTHVDLNLTLPQYTETIRQWEDSLGISYYPVRQNQLSSYLMIRQPLPTDGNLYIRSGAQNFIDYNADNRLTQLSTSIGFQQPLVAFYGYNRIRSAYKQAELSYDLSLKQYRREELNLVYDVSQTFYTLLQFHERLNIAGLSLKRHEEAYDIAQNKFNAGLIREVEALQMEVDLSGAINSFDIAHVNYTAQLNLFKEILGINLADSIIVKSELNYAPVSVEVNKAVEMALLNRLELKENEIQMEFQKMEIKRRKSEGMISGNLGVNYNLIGVDKSFLYVPLDDAFSNTWYNLNNRPGSFGIGLTVNIPIIDWGENRARVRAAEAVLAQSVYQMDGEKVSIERDIRTTVDRLHNSLKRLQMLEKNILVAEKSFEISRQRYANGEIDSQAMALETERLNNAFISRLEAFISYKLLLSDLMRKTFYDYERDMPVIAER